MAGKHAIMSPSGCGAWSVCSAYLDHQLGGSSEAADEGTAAHYVATCAFEQDKLATEFIGMTVWVPDDEDFADGETERFLVGEDDDPLTGRQFEVTREMANYVDQYLSEIDVQSWSILECEIDLDISWLTGEADATGRADFVRVDEGTIAVHDLKYGKGVSVSAESNKQLMMYAAAATKQYDWAGPFDTVELHIHQPRKGGHSVHEMSIEDLDRFVADLMPRCEAIINGDRSYAPGPHCNKHFCSYRKQCEARINSAMHETMAFFEDVEGKPIELSNDERLEKVYLKLTDIRDHIRTIEGAFYAKVKDGAMAGWKMVAGKKSRKFNDEKKAQGVFRRHCGLKLDDFMPRKMLTAAQTEKLVGKELYKKFDKVIEWSEGKPIPVPVSDKRPAIDNAESMGFEDIT